MKLEGAVINLLGDSITECVGASRPENGYPNVLAREYGVKINNYGICGSRIARQRVVTSGPYDQDFCMRLNMLDTTADAVVVFGGTNDFGHGEAPLGVPGDREPHTFYGACHTLMSGLLIRFVGKPVLIVTPLRRADEHDPRGDGTGRKTLSVAPLSTYRQIIMEVAAQYSLPVLDLYLTSGIQPAVDICRKRLLPDGLHPSDEGHAIIARRIGEFLKTL